MNKVAINCVSYSVAADCYDNVSERMLLVLPGWLSSKAYSQPLVSLLVDKAQTSALVIDYSGHGESPFNAMDIRPAQHFLEVISAFDWIKTSYPKAEITVMGFSYGGYMVVQLTKYRDFKNLILRAPSILAPRSFYSLNKDIDRVKERQYRHDQAFLDSHPLLARASKFEGRTLVVSHELDNNVPKQTTDKYAEIFQADKYLALGWSHLDKPNATTEEIAVYNDVLINWLNTNQ